MSIGYHATATKKTIADHQPEVLCEDSICTSQFVFWINGVIIHPDIVHAQTHVQHSYVWYF